MMREARPIRIGRCRERGLTLVELIVTVAILSILASAAVPIARFQVKRQNERELRYDLWMMRDAIDHYKDAADRGAFQTKVDSQNYPPDLETLVKGVEVQSKKVKFLRRIPVDPMTGKAEWGLRSMQDDPDSDSYGGQSVFDVYSKSQGTALDGTKYSDLVAGRFGIRGICAQNSQTRRGLYAAGADGRDDDHRHPHAHRPAQLYRRHQECPGSGAQGRPARDAGGHRLLHHGQAEGAAIAGRSDPGRLPEVHSRRPDDPLQRHLGDRHQRLADSLDQTDPGIDDVHSGADESGSNGETYNTW